VLPTHENLVALAILLTAVFASATVLQYSIPATLGAAGVITAACFVAGRAPKK
jgi:hypothetical protein